MARACVMGVLTEIVGNADHKVDEISHRDIASTVRFRSDHDIKIVQSQYL